LNKSEDVDAALQELGGDHCSFGDFTLTITVWDEDEQTATEKARAVQQVVDGVGLVTEIEDFNAVQAWMGSLPGHAYADVRRPLVSSLNVCDLVPLSAVWSGPARCAHLDGPPLLVTRTKGSTPFRMSLHQGDVGHTIIAGPTGAGKSTLLNLIACQWLRYPGARVYIFDKGASCRAMTLAMGGDFYDLGGEGEEICFQPLRRDRR
jgi:type IV secretory pathway VirB4 component